MNRIPVALISLVLLAACGPPEPEGPRPALGARAYEPPAAELRRAASDFEALRDEFVEWYLEAHPVRATGLGIHAHDSRLPGLTRADIQTRIDDLLGWVGRLERIPHSFMRGEDRFDYAVLEFGIRGELLELEEIRSWARDPRYYTNTLASGISGLVQREFAPPAERARALQGRMEAGVEMLAAARENLRNPPRVWTELAIADTRGLLDYVETAVPAALEAQAGGPVGGGAFGRARSQLAEALREHGTWLESELLPRSTGEFRLGRYLFERKLLYDEHVNLGVDELDRLNEQRIVEYHERVARVAAEIDPNRSPRQVMDSITRLHPEPEALIPTARDLMTEAREWVRANDIVTIPTDELPVVRETPPYARLGFASMNAPGPFEEADRTAYFNITNVDPSWTEEQQRQHLTYFNYGGLLGVVVHETFPGHFVQLMYEREYPSDVRKIFSPRTLREGWAHYSEQMVLDEGFRGDDPVIRLAQLRRALQRHARWYAGLHLHTRGRPLEEVVQRYMEIAFFDEFPARREVLRATYDPTYLYYALGRMQILELRSDYEAWVEEQNEEFSLRAFHDRFLRLGLPITLAHEALMPPPEPRRRNIDMF